MSNILDAVRDMPSTMPGPNESDILKVLNVLRTHVFDFVVAGGYARDKYYGHAPKDCDILIYNFHSSDPAENYLLGKAVEALSKFTDVRVCPAYEDDDSRLGNVIKLDYLSIDIIFYSRAASHHDVIKQFDCNMNQFYIPGSLPDYDSEDPSPLCLDKPVHINGDAPSELIYLCGGDLTSRRIAKMGQKWLSYTGTPITGEASEMYEAALMILDNKMPF